MKYRTELVVDAPAERVGRLYADPESMKKWQPGLISSELVSGEAGNEGAKSHLVFKMDKRRLEITETLGKRTPPSQFAAYYEAKGVKNWTEARFQPEGDKTRFVMDNEFKFSGPMWVIGTLFGGAFKKQTLKEMNQFKTFVEAAK